MGEDRSYGGNSFYIDLVPRKAWFANLRAMLPPPQWKQLSEYVIERADSRCEICGNRERLEAHERWDFDSETQVQKLVRLMCVCKLCHLSIHSGLAGELGFIDKTIEHITTVIGWTKAELFRHREAARKRWDKLSYLDWQQDISVAANAGLTPYSKDEVQRRIFDRRRKASAQRDSGTVSIDGLSYNLSDRRYADHAVFILGESNEEEAIGSISLGDGSFDRPWYAVKSQADIPSDQPSMEIKPFLLAWHQPYPINSEEDLQEALRDSSTPKRLILAKNIAITDDMANHALSRGIVLWKD